MTDVQDPFPGFKFGCDPELFLFDADGVPAVPDMIPGDKGNPFKIDFGAVQRDGMAAEFNIDPAENFRDFNRNINAVMKQLEGMIPTGYSLRAVPSVVFPEDVFNAAPDDAKELGCMPDFNAWTQEINPPPHDEENPYMRCAAGHLHIGFTENADLSDVQHIMNCCDLVKQLDWYLGAWSIKMDGDPTRRRLYGRAGACRIKDYGVEYRVLSNFWVTTRERRLAVWNRMQLAINSMAKKYMPDSVRARYNDILVSSINETKLHPDLSLFRYPISTTNPFEVRY